MLDRYIQMFEHEIVSRQSHIRDHNDCIADFRERIKDYEELNIKYEQEIFETEQIITRLKAMDGSQSTQDTGTAV
jgi:hypothetical protein